MRDPVCGAVFDEKTAKINFEGETNYFCSASCKKKFKRHAEKPNNPLQAQSIRNRLHSVHYSRGKRRTKKSRLTSSRSTVTRKLGGATGTYTATATDRNKHNSRQNQSSHAHGTHYRAGLSTHYNTGQRMT